MTGVKAHKYTQNKLINEYNKVLESVKTALLIQFHQSRI